MINEFRYGQTWKISPSPLSLSLYSTFKLQKLADKKRLVLFHGKIAPTFSVTVCGNTKSRNFFEISLFKLQTFYNIETVLIYFEKMQQFVVRCCTYIKKG